MEICENFNFKNYLKLPLINHTGRINKQTYKKKNLFYRKKSCSQLFNLLF